MQFAENFPAYFTILPSMFPEIWRWTADTLNGMMMLPNLVGVLALSPVVARITKNYVAHYPPYPNYPHR